MIKTLIIIITIISNLMATRSNINSNCKENTYHDYNYYNECKNWRMMGVRCLDNDNKNNLVLDKCIPFNDLHDITIANTMLIKST